MTDPPSGRSCDCSGLGADAAGESDGDVSAGSAVVRAHRHASGAQNGPPPASKRGAETEHRDETARQSLPARLAEAVREARAWAARGAGSPPSFT